MRAIVDDHGGGPDVLRLVDRPEPTPGNGEVRVRVLRSGVNPADWKWRAMKADVRFDRPLVPHHDGSGIVDAVGPGVRSGLIGRRVWLYDAAYAGLEGTAQELLVVPASRVADLPESASFDLRASLGVPLLTAHRALTVNDDGPRRLSPAALDGRVVLVAGGAGAVGNAAIQLAAWSGARVIATVSDGTQARLAAAAGADDVLEYRTDNLISGVRRIAPRGVDTIVEVAGGVNAALDVSLVAPHGCVACYGSEGLDAIRLPGRALTPLNVRWQFLSVFLVPAAAKAAAVEDVGAALRAGAIDAGEDRGLPLLSPGSPVARLGRKARMTWPESGKVRRKACYAR